MKKKKQIGTFIGNYHTGYIWNWWKFPHDLWRELKAFYQRGMYGYASSDLYSLAGYLTSWMPEALTQLSEEGGEIIDFAASDMDFNLMIDGWLAARQLLDGDFAWDDTTKTLKSNHKELTEDLEKRRIKGMERFVKDFLGLWW